MQYTINPSRICKQTKCVNINKKTLWPLLWIGFNYLKATELRSRSTSRSRLPNLGQGKGTSRSKLYKELGLQSLKSGRTFRCLCLFHKIISTGLPTYLFNLIPKSTHGYQTRTLGDIFPHINVGCCAFNKIHPETWNASLTAFKKHLLKEIHPISHLVYSICNPNGLELLTRLRLGLDHLNEDRFNQNCENCINLLCTCSLKGELTSHFFLHWHYYDFIGHIMFNDLCEVDINLQNVSGE